MIGLIGAMAVEVEGLMARMENRAERRIGMDTFVSGKLFGQDAVLAVCGPGKVNAALCAQSMILAYHPEWVLNLGVAGAGDEDVSIGDMVIATCAVQHDSDTSPLGDPVGLVSKVNLVEFPCDEGLGSRLERAARRLDGVRVHRGVIATGDQFIHKGDVRRRIHMRSGMGIHAQERFPEAVLLDRVRRGQPGLLRPRVNRHRFADGLCQVNHLHIISPLASC